MLENIDPLSNADLLRALDATDHGDDINRAFCFYEKPESLLRCRYR